MGRRWTAALICAGIFSLAVGISGQQQNAAQPGDERTFVSHVALANMAEIQLGHLAVKKAQHPDVRKFAERMIDAHLKVQKDLADAASGAGVPWPTQLDDKYRKIQQRLSALSNEQFDREYMQTVIDGHRDVEQMLAGHVSDGGSDPLAANVSLWATKTLPAVRAHLKMAEQVSGALNRAE